MPPSLAVLWFYERGNFFVSSFYEFKVGWLVFYLAIEWLSQQTRALEAGPASACHYCSVMAEVCAMDPVWVAQLHGLLGLTVHIVFVLSMGWRSSVMAACFVTTQLKSYTKFWLLPWCILVMWTSVVSRKYRDNSCSFWNVSVVLALRKINIKAWNNS